MDSRPALNRPPLPKTKNNWTKDERAAEAVRLYLRRYSYREAAAKVGVTPKRCQDYVREWKDQQAARLNPLLAVFKEEETAKLDELEKEYWRAWERSQGDAVKRVDKSDAAEPGPQPPDPIGGPTSAAGKGTTTVERKGQVGDPRFLDGIKECIRLRCQLRGLMVPKPGSLDDGEEMVVREYHESADPRLLQPDPRRMLPPRTVTDATEEGDDDESADATAEDRADAEPG